MVGVTVTVMRNRNEGYENEFSEIKNDVFDVEQEEKVKN